MSRKRIILDVDDDGSTLAKRKRNIIITASDEEMTPVRTPSADRTPAGTPSADVQPPILQPQAHPQALSVMPSPAESQCQPQPQAINWDEWFSATSTRNFLLKDPLLDWLALYSGKISANHPQYSSKVLKVMAKSWNPSGGGGFVPQLMAQGNVFEKKVVTLLYHKFGKDAIIDIGDGGDGAARSVSKFEETVAAMNSGIPIIHGGVFHNHDTKTYGITDLLIRSDFVNKIFSIAPISNEEARSGAPLLKNAATYHYIVIDIKFTTLLLRSDGIHILNSGAFPAYKTQLYIYNEALGKVQGYTPRSAYVMGRKWRYVTKGETYKGFSCFDRLGHINFEGLDREYIDKTKQALGWLDRLRKEGSEWNVVNVPLSRPELYPNMSNHYDFPWGEVKKDLAGKNFEITNVWYCGPAQREAAHKNGIYKWNDSKCNARMLGIKGEKIGRTVNHILDCNRQTEHPILPRVIENDSLQWRTRPNELEFFVDFETINDVFGSMDKLPYAEKSPLIFMIGVGYIEPVSKKWIYRDFTVNAIRNEEEKEMCSQFASYITDVSNNYKEKNPRLVHWSHAEEYQWEKAIEKNKLEWISDIEPRWFDLLDVFRDEPIVVRGSLTFGLKEVAKAMKAHGMIATQWGDGPYSDGSSAMLGAYHSSQDAAHKNISMRETPQMKEIVKYNEVDCKVMQEIITYLRKLS